MVHSPLTVAKMCLIILKINKKGGKKTLFMYVNVFSFILFRYVSIFCPPQKKGVLPKDRNPITEINTGTQTVLTPLFYFYFTHNPKTLHGHPEPGVSTPSDGFTPEMTRAYLLSGHSSLKGHGGKDLIGSGVPVRKTNCRKIPLGNKGHASRYYP